MLHVTFEIWHMICDTWHGTHDIGHMTRDRWVDLKLHSKFHVRHRALTVWRWRCFEDFFKKEDLITKWMNYLMTKMFVEPPLATAGLLVMLNLTYGQCISKVIRWARRGSVINKANLSSYRNDRKLSINSTKVCGPALFLWLAATG